MPLTRVTLYHVLNGLSRGKARFPLLLVTVLLGRVTVDAALEQLETAKLQELAAWGLMEGDHSPPGVHPYPPNPAVLLFFLGQRDPPSLCLIPFHFMRFSYKNQYAIFAYPKMKAI